MKIALAADHGAYAVKEKVKSYLGACGYEVEDFGTHSTESCDYTDFALLAGEAVSTGFCERGILLCTTGIGMSIAANKIRGIRAALCTNTLMAALTREHNDTNVLVLGAGITAELLSLRIVDTWLDTDFTGGERHQRRIDKITALEGANSL